MHRLGQPWANSRMQDSQDSRIHLLIHFIFQYWPVLKLKLFKVYSWLIETKKKKEKCKTTGGTKKINFFLFSSFVRMLLFYEPSYNLLSGYCVREEIFLYIYIHYVIIYTHTNIYIYMTKILISYFIIFRYH